MEEKEQEVPVWEVVQARPMTEEGLEIRRLRAALEPWHREALEDPWGAGLRLAELEPDAQRQRLEEIRAHERAEAAIRRRPPIPIRDRELIVGALRPLLAGREDDVLQVIPHANPLLPDNPLIMPYHRLRPPPDLLAELRQLEYDIDSPDSLSAPTSNDTIPDIETEMTWYQFALATQVRSLDQSGQDIHKAFNSMVDKPFVTRLLEECKSIYLPPMERIIYRWKKCMMYLHYYYSLQPVIFTPEEISRMSLSHIHQMLDWLVRSNLQPYLVHSPMALEQFDSVVGLLERVPDSYKPVVAELILSGIFASYERRKIITLLNWVPEDSASCGPGSIDYMILQCGRAIQVGYNIPQLNIHSINIEDWVLHQLYDVEEVKGLFDKFIDVDTGSPLVFKSGESRELLSNMDEHTRIEYNKERLRQFLLGRVAVSGETARLTPEQKRQFMEDLNHFITIEYEKRRKRAGGFDHGILGQYLGKTRKQIKKQRKRTIKKRLQKKNGRKTRK